MGSEDERKTFLNGDTYKQERQNGEGCDDPTACEALANIQQEERALRGFRPIVYICSP